MKYCIATFKKEIPNVTGVTLRTSLAFYQVFQVEDSAWPAFPENYNVPWEEITELEATEAVKFYGEVRGYRSAYSDEEGLEPDADYLAKGQRKTRVYITDEIEAAVISLMRKVSKKVIVDEFDRRVAEEGSDRTGEDAALAQFDACTTIKELNQVREDLLGVQMPKAQLLELGLWDEESNTRIGQTDYSFGF